MAMERKVHCPVCQAAMLVDDVDTQRGQGCSVCGTRFTLPLRRRQAAEGSPDQDQDPD
jgi:hypothetical protein